MKILLILLLSLNIFAQDEIEIEEKVISFEEIKNSRLHRIKDRIYEQRKEQEKLRQLIKTEGRGRLDLLSKIDAIEETISADYISFIEVATNINPKELLSSEIVAKSTLLDDFQQLLAPALEGIKRASERPRKIENLKTKIEDSQGQQALAQEIIAKLDKRIDEEKDRKLRIVLKAAKERAEVNLEKVKDDIANFKYQLKNELNKDSSVVSQFTELIFTFIKTKGKNLFLAFIAFLVIFWPLRKWRSRILQLAMKKMKRGQSLDTLDWMLRPLTVLYNFITSIFAFIVGFLTLYFLHDWLLVTLFILVFMGIAWSTKQYLPNFIDQLRLVLNLGQVREKERIIYKGIPWKVSALGFYCYLHNPLLKGGKIKIHAKELTRLFSRAVVAGEPWFPTQEGDWILVNGEIYGQVILQTPDQVIMEVLGGSHRIFPTSNFYLFDIQNLSKNFPINIYFRVDYQHQDYLLENVLPTFKNRLSELLADGFEGDNPRYKKLIVEFNDAGASSLNIFIRLECFGHIANERSALTRLLNQYCLQICNENNLIIPFQQITVHYANAQDSLPEL